MATHIQLIQLGGFDGLLYVFDKRGEGLLMHEHEADTAHDIMVLEGAVQIYGPTYPIAFLTQGDNLNLEWWKPHEVLALADHTVTFHKFINGVPELFKNLPMDRRVGTAHDTLHKPINYHSVL